MEKYASKTNRHLFLHIKHVKKPRNEAENSAQESGIPEKVSRMAIGVEGGFSADVKKDEFEEINQIIIIPSYQTFSIGKFFTKKNVKTTNIYKMISRVFFVFFQTFRRPRCSLGNSNECKRCAPSRISYLQS